MPLSNSSRKTLRRRRMSTPMPTRSVTKRFPVLNSGAISCLFKANKISGPSHDFRVLQDGRPAPLAGPLSSQQIKEQSPSRERFCYFDQKGRLAFPKSKGSCCPNIQSAINYITSVCANQGGTARTTGGHHFGLLPQRRNDVFTMYCSDGRKSEIDSHLLFGRIYQRRQQTRWREQRLGVDPSRHL